jgi:hypothetical protein
MNISEEDVKSHMEQFKVDREQAMKEIKDVIEDYYNEQDISMQETLESIKSDMY